MRVRAVVAYDGTDFCGFQRQADGRTVQAVLEEALAQVTRESVPVVAAGRTDAGVHALGQVIAFDSCWRHSLGDLQQALNAVLPADVVAREVADAVPGFHPRYDARRRRYRYTLYVTPVRLALARQYGLHVFTAPDVDAMQQAADALVGEHDFATFGRSPRRCTRDGATVRRVFVAEWQQAAGWSLLGLEEPMGLVFEVVADAFLYRMVRSIVGTLLEVGRGAMDVEGFKDALAARDRARAGPTAPPHGLCLVGVEY
jgi:tRNA pseudouridine38-40 synthase